MKTKQNKTNAKLPSVDCNPINDLPLVLFFKLRNSQQNCRTSLSIFNNLLHKILFWSCFKQDITSLSGILGIINMQIQFICFHFQPRLSTSCLLAVAVCHKTRDQRLCIVRSRLKPTTCCWTSAS